MGLCNYFIFFFSMGAEKINPGQEHLHLLSGNLPHFDFPHGPRKLIVVKTLHPEAEPVLIPVQYLDRSPRCPAKHVKIPIERILPMLLLHQYRKCFDLFPHIRVPHPTVDVYFVPVDPHIAPLTAQIIRLNISELTSSATIIRIQGSNRMEISRHGLSSVATATNIGRSREPLIRLLQYWNVEYAIRLASQKSRCVSPLCLWSRITPRQCCSLVGFMLHLRAL
jgi:hypothetical protein